MFLYKQSQHGKSKGKSKYDEIGIHNKVIIGGNWCTLFFFSYLEF